MSYLRLSSSIILSRPRVGLALRRSLTGRSIRPFSNVVQIQTATASSPDPRDDMSVLESLEQKPVTLEGSVDGHKPKRAFKPAPTCTDAITAHDVMRAYKRIRSNVAQSPLDYSPSLSALTGANVYLKKEHVSLTGSYKERGALNKLLTLTEDEKARGVICSSAGNHAQAVSYHSTRLGIDSVIVMPENAPYVKVQSTRSLGGQVVLSGQSFTEAYERACQIAEEQGRTFIHAFNDSKIVAGQGTVAMELLEQNPYIDAVIVPVGGGGLAAGMSLLIKHVNPRIKVYGVESVAMPGMYKSFKEHKLQGVPKSPSIADGIAVENVGAVPYEYIAKHVDDMLLVEEVDIAAALLLLLEKEKTVVEGSGAAALAALLTEKVNLKGQNVAILCTGGNIDMSLLGRIIEKGLVKSGRLARIRVTVPDVPGQLARVCQLVTSLQANIKDIEHERAFLLANVGFTSPLLTLETMGFDHVNEIIAKLEPLGVKATLQTPAF